MDSTHRNVSCNNCDGSGFSEKANQLYDLWYGRSYFRPHMRDIEEHRYDNPIILKEAERNVRIKRPDSKPTVYRESLRLANFYNSQWRFNLNENDINSLLLAGKLIEFTHIWSKEAGWSKKDIDFISSPKDFNNASLKLSPGSNIAYYVIKAECEKLGKSIECSTCSGFGKYETKDYLVCKSCKGLGFIQSN